MYRDIGSEIPKPYLIYSYSYYEQYITSLNLFHQIESSNYEYEAQRYMHFFGRCASTKGCHSGLRYLMVVHLLRQTLLSSSLWRNPYFRTRDPAFHFNRPL